MKYSKKFARQKIMVNGEPVQVLILGEGAELPIGENISREMDRVSAHLAYWGSVLAAARAEQVLVDAYYRKFRSHTTTTLIENNPKIPAYRVTAEIETSEGFIQHKQAVSQATYNVALCEAMVKAYDKKANLLQSKGARVRAELSAQNTATSTNHRDGWNLSSRGSHCDDKPMSAADNVKKKKRVR